MYYQALTTAAGKIGASVNDGLKLVHLSKFVI